MKLIGLYAFSCSLLMAQRLVLMLCGVCEKVFVEGDLDYFIFL